MLACYKAGSDPFIKYLGLIAYLASSKEHSFFMSKYKAFRFLPLLFFFSLSYLHAEGLDYLKIDHTRRFETVGNRSYEVIDIRQMKEYPATNAPGIMNIDASRAFKPGTVFFGFGLPNVYLGRVVDDGKFEKFDAKSLMRAESQITETDGRTQSGVFLVPKNLAPEAIEKIEQIATENVGTRKVTCARANAIILHQAGFTVGRERMDGYLWPASLLRAILENGLEYQSEKIEFDIVISKPMLLEEFIYAIEDAQKPSKTLARHSQSDSEEAKELRRQKAQEIRSGYSDLIPAEEGISKGNTFEVYTGKATTLGTYFRKIWGAHVLYEVSLSASYENNVSEFLPEKLKAFPQKNPSWGTWAKKNFIFSPASVWGIRYNMASDYTKHSGISEHDFIKMIEADTPELPNKYNFVITGEKIIIAKLNAGNNKAVSWALCKHAIAANYSDDVRFAGEFWKGSDNVIYFNNNSGTYRPTPEHLEQAEQFLQSMFTQLKVQGIRHVEE